MAWPSDGSYTSWTNQFKVTSQASKISAVLDWYFFDLSLMPSDFWSNVQAGGDDLRFTEDDGETAVYHKLIYINSGTETGLVAVAQPHGTGGASADVDTYCYVGNAGASSTSSASAFPSSMTCLYMLQEPPTSSTAVMDWTANARHSTNIYGSMTSGDLVTGGPHSGLKCLAFDSNDAILLPSTIFDDCETANAYTWFGWAKLVNDSDDRGVFGSAGSQLWIRWDHADGGYVATHRNSTNSANFEASGINVGGWEFVCVVYNGSTLTLYKNGVSIGSTSATSMRSASLNFYIGSDNTTFWQGELAEIGFYSEALSADQLATWYANEMGPDFWVVAGGGGGTGTGALVAAAATLSGAGITGKTGTGSLSAPVAAVAGSGTQTLDGTGALLAPTGDVDGAGVTGRTGTGSLTAPAGVVAGSNEPPVTTTGWQLFQTATNGGGGDTSWANANNALVDDATTASCALSDRDISDFLVLTNPVALGIPSGAEITDVEFRIKRRGGDIYDFVIRPVKGGVQVGTDLADTLTEWLSSDVTVDYGGGLLGTTWADTDFGSGFGLAIQVEDTDSGADTAYVITVWTRVSWADGSGKTGTGAISAPASVLSGSGIQTITGTGALTGYVGEVDGSGTSATPIFGTGELESPMPSVLGDGEIQSGNQDLDGALTVSAGVIQGSGITSKTGTAALTHPMPIVAGSGKSTISGTGALTAPDGYIVAGSGLLSPPDAVGTAGLVAPAGEVSGTGFALGSAALAVDSIAWYLTGASAAGKSQRDQSLSLGGFRSGVSVRSMTWDCRQPMVGVEILGVGALNGRGTGSLEAITDNSLRWTPPGGVAGVTVTLAQGQEAKLFGFESGAWIQVRRNSTLPMVGIHSVQCVDIYNNAIGFDNVASADAVAGETFYRAVMGKNEFDGPMTDIKIWLDADANTGIAIGYEAVVADEIQDIADDTTAPTGITWVTGTTSATGIEIPSVSAGASFGLWIRKTIAADSDPSPSELVHIHVQYGDLVPTTRLDDLRGKYRIARTDYETFGIWIGQDAQPDLDAAADEEFTSRPHTTSLSLDLDHIYYAVVRWRNKWGLWSQNTTATALPMNAGGDQGFVAPHGPSAVAITQSGNNYPIFSARYEPSQDVALANLTRNDPGRAEIFVLWHTRDDSTPDPTDTPSAYGLMGVRAGVETLKYTETGTAFLDGTPVKALVRTRRLAIGAGTIFSPDTTQLPTSGAGTIVVDSELTGWESTGYLKVTTFSGSLQEVVEYSNLVIGSGISTFTVGSGGRGLWGTTAAATVANNVIYPVTPVDSENTEVTEYTIDGIAPGRPWGDLLFGTDAAQEQEPIEGPDGATEEYISVPNDHYLLLGEGWCELWMGSDLVWKVFQDGNAFESNGLYIPSEWTVATGAISGASTGVFDSVSADSLYIVAGLVRRVHINSSAMTITMPSLSSLGGIPEVAPQSSTWEQYAGTLLQSWDPERQDYRPYAQLTTAGLLTSQWTVYNDLTQAEIVAL